MNVSKQSQVDLVARIDMMLNFEYSWPNQISQNANSYFKTRKELLAWIKDLIDVRFDVNSIIFNQIATHVESFESLTAMIMQRLSGQSVDFNSINAELNAAISSIQSLSNDIDFKYQSQVIANKLSSISQNGIDSKLESEFKAQIELAKSLNKDMKDAIQILTDKAAETGRKEQVDSLEKQAKSHRTIEYIWLSIFTFAFIVFWVWLYRISIYVIPKIGEAIDIPTVIQHSVVSCIFISAVGVIIRISFSRYLAERSLRIMYKHRISVIQQYPNLETGLSTDSELKNSMRLELAKFIFADPAIGSTKDAGDININPFIQVAEKAAEKLAK